MNPGQDIEVGLAILGLGWVSEKMRKFGKYCESPNELTRTTLKSTTQYPPRVVLLFNIGPNRVAMVWNVILHAVRFILAKYEPVATHGNLF